MADLRTLLAAVIGVGLGLVLVVYPTLVVRVHAAGRLPPGRGGEYGRNADPPERWRRLVQAAGVLVLLAGVYFALAAGGVLASLS